jgi:hypothetical protein
MKCHASPIKLLGLLALTSLMVAVSYFCTTWDDVVAQIVGWLGIAFFGLGFIVVPVQMLTFGPMVIINEVGIEDRRLRLGMIPWEEIHAITTHSIEGCPFLGLHLRDPGRYLARMPWWKRFIAKSNVSIGYSPFTIAFVGLTPGFDEASAFIQEAWRRHTAKRGFSTLDP